MVIKRLKLYQFLNGMVRTFSYRQAWVLQAGPLLGGFRPPGKNVLEII